MRPKITKTFVDSKIFNDIALAIPASVTIHKYAGSWGVKITSGEHNLRHEIDISASNTSQERLYKEIVCWIDCAGNEDSQHSLYPVARSISKWISDTIGEEVVTLLNTGKIVIDHHYVTVDYEESNNLITININKDGRVIKAASGIDLMCFLNVFPDTVIYPSAACSFVEDSVLWNGREDIQAKYLEGIEQQYPIRKDYWLAVLMKVNLTYEQTWGKEGLEYNPSNAIKGDSCIG